MFLHHSKYKLTFTGIIYIEYLFRAWTPKRLHGKIPTITGLDEIRILSRITQLNR